MKTLNKYKILIVLLGLPLIIIIARYLFPDVYYNLREKWVADNHIEWSETENLQWKHFGIDKKESPGYIYASVGISLRFDTENQNDIRSKTLFNPLKSKAYDTINPHSLRLVNAKFDLLEVYRRRMANEIDSIFSNKIKGLSTNFYYDLNKKYYAQFEQNWQEFINREENSWSIYELENWIDTELEKE